MTNLEQTNLMDDARRLAREVEDACERAVSLGDRRRLPKLAAVALKARDELAPMLRALAEELQQERVAASAAQAELARLAHPANRGREIGVLDLLGYDEADFF